MKDRHSKSQPCPICGGYDALPRGHSVRCIGFIPPDVPNWVHCSREEYAGDIPFNLKSQTYAHWLGGPCKCGHDHRAETPSANGQNGNSYPNGYPQNGSGQNGTNGRTNGQSNGRSNGKQNGQSHIVDIADFGDEQGNLLFQEVRYEPKSFRLRRPDGEGGWIWDLKGVRLVLWNLEGVINSRLDEVVYICEGKKDAERLLRMGLVATTNPMGAGNWRPEYNGVLSGRLAVILQDNDQAGRNHSEKAAYSLHGTAASVKILALPGLPEHGDVSDWLDSGHTLGDLLQAAKNALEWQPQATPLQLDYQEPQPKSERFAPIDLSTQDEPEAMRWVFATYIPEGVPCNLYADGGQGKSTLALALACHIVLGRPFLGLPVMQGPVLILDWELSIEHALRRLYAIARGMGLATPPKDLYYQSLHAPLSQHFVEICEFMSRVKPVLTILDSFGPAAGCDPNDTEEVIKYMAQVRQLPTTPLNIDHQAKPGQTSYASKRAYGSGYKDYLVRGGMQVEVASSKEGQTSVVMRHTKHNFSAGAEPLGFHIIYGPGTIRLERGDIMDTDFLDVETLSAPDKILRVLEQTVEGMAEEDLMFEAGINSTSTFRNAMTKLRKAGKAIVVGSTAPGKKQLYRLANTNENDQMAEN